MFSLHSSLQCNMNILKFKVNTERTQNICSPLGVMSLSLSASSAFPSYNQHGGLIAYSLLRWFDYPIISCLETNLSTRIGLLSFQPIHFKWSQFGRSHFAEIDRRKKINQEDVQIFFFSIMSTISSLYLSTRVLAPSLFTNLSSHSRIIVAGIELKLTR